MLSGIRAWNFHSSSKNVFKFLHSTCYNLNWNLTNFTFDDEYLLDPKNIVKIEDNIKNRKGVGDIKLVHELKNKLDKTALSDGQFQEIKTKLFTELQKIPNKTHPDLFNYGDDPKVIKTVGSQTNFESCQKDFEEIVKRLSLVRTEQLGNVSGNRSYYLTGELAELEHALINYFLHHLLTNGYQLISVPDILPREVIERCGMNTRGERNQVYTLDSKLHGNDLCLSGTSEMALAGYLADEEIEQNELPLKLCSFSRCYRAETSSVAQERGIYRVHEFTKVEMFIACEPDSSDNYLEEIRKFEEEQFASLGLHFQVLDMPPHELGAQAYRKYDIEAWMPGRKLYGEISSCSNCTDFQARRLGIKYRDKNGDFRFVHTLNGTACAIPRMLIALVESGQNSNGTITIPEKLQKYINGKKVIGRQKKVPELKLIKNKKNK